MQEVQQRLLHDARTARNAASYAACSLENAIATFAMSASWTLESCCVAVACSPWMRLTARFSWSVTAPALACRLVSASRFVSRFFRSVVRSVCTAAGVPSFRFWTIVRSVSSSLPSPASLPLPSTPANSTLTLTDVPGPSARVTVSALP